MWTSEQWMKRMNLPPRATAGRVRAFSLDADGGEAASLCEQAAPGRAGDENMMETWTPGGPWVREGRDDSPPQEERPCVSSPPTRFSMALPRATPGGLAQGRHADCWH